MPRESQFSESVGSARSDGAAYARWLEHRDPEIVANTIICLIHQANYLLD